MLKIDLQTQYGVASESPDHKMPWGTRHDSSRNWRFNWKLFELFKAVPLLKVLDLGCSGGGFVRSCIDDGCLAVGLEGSDYSKLMRRSEWAVIPECLFTCDIAHPFQLVAHGATGVEPLKFHVVTTWEVIEHLREEELPCLAENVAKHLTAGGVWILSVSENEEVIGGVVLHQTVRPKRWWVDKLQSLGFVHCPEHEKYFNGQYVRGPKQGDRGSFPLILAKSKEGLPVPPQEPLRQRMYDLWYGSPLQRFIKLMIVGLR